MISHEPEGYRCPDCVFLNGGPEDQIHVFPRYRGDELYFTRKSRVDEAVRAGHAARLRDRLLSGA